MVCGRGVDDGFRCVTLSGFVAFAAKVLGFPNACCSVVSLRAGVVRGDAGRADGAQPKAPPNRCSNDADASYFENEGGPFQLDSVEHSRDHAAPAGVDVAR